MQMGHTSSWMHFGTGHEEVFIDGQMRLAAVCNDSHETQSKKNVLGCSRRQVAVSRFSLEILIDGECCSISDYIPINPTKGYKFSIYIKSTVKKRICMVQCVLKVTSVFSSMIS